MGKRHNIGIIKPPYKCFLSELFIHNKKLQFLSFPATSPQKCFSNSTRFSYFSLVLVCRFGVGFYNLLFLILVRHVVLAASYMFVIKCVS
nr:MAG TPA: hypothetical protein [Caudoviricetes sp.]